MSTNIPQDSLLPPERELCLDMGVSRTVIREAIKLLETQGLVRIEHGRGTLVQAPNSIHVADFLELLLRRTNHQLEHLTEVRKILELRFVEPLALDDFQSNSQKYTLFSFSRPEGK